MQTMTNAVRAYASAAEHRNVREQEADIFRRANAALRYARESAKRISRVRALADNDRLWMTILGLLHDPANALPDELRASIISVGLAVQREMQRDSPDFDFLIEINENIAAGLSGNS
jgi:flagellar protein FlaF